MAETNRENEYVIKDVPRHLTSDECHTRGTLPRITQPTYGKYMVRVDAKDDYLNEEVEVHPKILENWLIQNRYCWVDRPGKNDYFIHNIFKKYSIKTMEYNPRKRFQVQIIPRPYSCEMDYIIARRLYCPEASHIYEDETFCNLSDSIYAKKKIECCKILPPFWWKEIEKKGQSDEDTNGKHEGINEFKELRWRPIPNPVGTVNMTCCDRKEALHSVGIPFQHEACTFYNEHFPAPKLTFAKKKFNQ